MIDTYIKRLLCQGFNFKHSDIPKELVECKRAHLVLKRELWERNIYVRKKKSHKLDIHKGKMKEIKNIDKLINELIDKVELLTDKSTKRKKRRIKNINDGRGRLADVVMKVSSLEESTLEKAEAIANLAGVMIMSVCVEIEMNRYNITLT